ncbi:MlaE family ABC transporter permease, partial [Rhodoferax ferrireducens]|uniref:MlaE family ABC transporter permease n=1 Tax=Rhodoferax ferrireducens TaxID=192843 RepID=UPI003BB6E38F
MTPEAPNIERSDVADGAGLRLSGDWSAARLAEPANWARLRSDLSFAAPGDAVKLKWDLRDLQRLDHTGAQVLWNAWGRQWPTQLLIEPAQRAMLSRVEQYSLPPPVARRTSAWQLFLALGALVWLLIDHLRDATRLLGQLLLDTLRLLRAPAKGPWRDVSGHLFSIGATALPITALLGFLIGVVLAYLMSLQLRQFGADSFIVNILGLSVIRELGPVLAAILIAGRSGSTITAQIGVMRVTEELDAMRVMGIAKG